MSEWTLENPRLSRRLDVGADVDVEQWRLSVPAKGACYLLADEEDRPVLLSITGNLREALVNRLTAVGGEQPSKRTDYRAVTRRVCWRPVYSRFEANWTYMETARRIFPGRYSKMVRHWRAYWVSVDPKAEFPRFVVGGPEGEAFGPIATRKQARGVIEALEDMFDLCRYHEILVAAPHGKACAYKEMGKCPGPCDGTVSMEHYRGQICEALGALRDARKWIEGARQRMAEHAKGLRFEEAARLKGKIERASALERLEWMRPVERMRWMVLAKGRRKGCVRAFVVVPGRIVFAGEMQKRNRGEQLEWLAGEARKWMDGGGDGGEADRIALVSWHLLRGVREPGVLVELEDACDARLLGEAVERVGK